ncbi:MAG: hypothetical protein LBH43_05615 [Treponema sp.]|jgi:hypothetical protein|nr:hypothetical protein [Treponema sp.]
MEKIKTLPQIRIALMNEIMVLQELSTQAYRVESNIKRIVSCINDLKNDYLPSVNEKKPNIIPFPIPVNTDKGLMQQGRKEKSAGNDVFITPFLYEGVRKHPFLIPILAKPGVSLPVAIPDFRNTLQRDGLILLSWDKRLTEKGELYTAYWVTSSGVCRYFASSPMLLNDFSSAHPAHKSYAAEDGIEFYRQPRPYYIVHVAPELMMNNRGNTDKRPEHIKKLQELGVKNDFDYTYLLTREKKKLKGRLKTAGFWEKTRA